MPLDLGEYPDRPPDQVPGSPVNRIRGLGDLVHLATKKTGIAALVRKVRPGGCGCKKRREKLNRAFPFPEKH